MSSFLSDVDSRLLVHFYTSFLAMNSFTGKSSDDYNGVHSQLQISPALSEATKAVSSLYVQRQPINPLSTRVRALVSYRAAIAYVQTDLKDRHRSRSNAVLWSTFFLGLFELMYDISGEGWMKHFLYGTSRILQHCGPEAHLTGMGRRFFLTFRVFEISRALIFTEETFLSKQGWQGLHGQIWTGGDVEDWHPKEALFDLMVSCSCLGNRGFRLVQALHEFPEQKKHQELQAISVQGSLLQDGLRDWKSAALTWHPPLSAARDDQMTLALIFHHASTVYLSGLFDYFPYWNERQIPTPTLSASVAQEHVRAILSMTVAALKETTLAGILFLFPLRVAGARASSAQQRNVIAGMLEDISRRGFVVADAFTADLKELWGHRREEIGGDQLDKEIADSSNVG